MSNSSNTKHSDQPVKPSKKSEQLIVSEAISCSEGASFCNTAPYKYIDTQNQYIYPLRSGIDSLYLSFKGSISNQVEKKLLHLKEIAQNKTQYPTSESFISIAGHDLEVSAKGSGKFAFVMSDNWFRIEVSSGEVTTMPLAYVQIRSELLTFYPLDVILKQLFKIIRILGADEITTSISRVDLCLDFIFLNNFTFKSVSDKNWRTKAHLINSYTINKELSGFSIGKNDIVGRIYNKSLEIKKSGKDYLPALWKETGWDEKKDVWRVEFQFRKEVLKTLGIVSEVSLIMGKDKLWSYATCQWLELVTPNENDSNASRWPVHPAWIEISQACINEPTKIIKRVTKERLPSIHYLFVHGLSPITTYMAMNNITDEFEAIQGFYQDAKHYHDVFRDKPLKMYLQEKARDKGKRYNTLKREPNDE